MVGLGGFIAEKVKHLHPSGDATPSGYFKGNVDQSKWRLMPYPISYDESHHTDAEFARTFKNSNYYSGFTNAIFQIDTKSSTTTYDGINKATIIPKQ